MTVAPPARPARLLLRFLLGLPLCAAACRSADVAEYSLSTPERSLDSYKRAHAAGDYEQEYRTLSRELIREIDLSYNTYTIGRGSFLRQHRREVRLFLRSEIVSVTYSPDRRRAVIELAAGGEVGAIELVNEPEYEWVVDDGTGRGVESGGDLPGDVPSVVTVKDGVVVIEVPLDGESLAEGEIAEFRVARAWRFRKLLGIEEFRFDSAGDGSEEPDPADR